MLDDKGVYNLKHLVEMEGYYKSTISKKSHSQVNTRSF